MVQAQQRFLLVGPPSSVAGRRGRLGRVDPEARCMLADRLRVRPEAPGDVLERAPADGQLQQALVVVDAPAPRVGDQLELPGACRQARRVAVGELAGDFAVGQRAGVAVRITASSHSDHRRRGDGRWSPRCCACRRGASGERPRRYASAVRSPSWLTQRRIASSSWDRYGRPAGPRPTRSRRRARTCSGERPWRWARTAADRPAATPALSSASSARDQRLARRGGIRRLLRRATTASGERPSRREMCSMGSRSA